MRGTNTNGNGAATLPIARSFALVVLFALAVLIILRHLFGSIRIEGGVR